MKTTYLFLLLCWGHYSHSQTKKFKINTIQLTDAIWAKPYQLDKNTLNTNTRDVEFEVKANCNAPLNSTDFIVWVNNERLEPVTANCIENLYKATVRLKKDQYYSTYVEVTKGSSTQKTSTVTLSTHTGKPLIKRYALVIGNSTYQHGSSLSNRPFNDATDISERLKSMGFNVSVKTDADKRSMERALKEFSNQIEGADMALFFYAGHGIETGGLNYLLPIDAELQKPSDADVEAVNVQTFLDKLKNSGSAFSVMILDACRNNPFKNWPGAMRGNGDERGFRPITNLQGKGNIYLATATDWGNTAQNGQNRNGVYTEALLKYLRQGSLLEDVLNRAAIEVKRITNGQQNPQLLTEPATDLKFSF